MMKLAGKPSKNSVRSAVMVISEPINDLVINRKTNHFAIAFSLATAMSSIIRQIVSDESADQFMTALIVHIDTAQVSE